MASEHDALRRAARAAWDAGICVLPPAQNGTKRPVAAWKQYQTTRPAWRQVEIWLAHGTGLGVLCGAVSGGLELLEFDHHATYLEYVSAARKLGLGELIDRIETGYLETSPKGGTHWFYRNDEVRGNTKLAAMPDDDGKVTVLIETRGEGGYAVTAPSYGSVHPTRLPYRLIQGGFDTIATITSAERDALWNLARTFDLMPHMPGNGGGPEAADTAWHQQVPGGSRPGDDFNARANWADILEGWVKVFTRGDVTYWRRPGKQESWSATTGFCGDRLFVFSTSTNLPSNKVLTKFSAYSYMHHGGDFAAAARALGQLGYGTPAPRPVQNGNGPIAGRIGPVPGPPAAGPPPGGFHLTDTGNAERLVARRGQDMRFCHPWGKWLIWDGTRWKVDDMATARAYAKEMVRGIYAEAAAEADDDARKAIAKWAKASESDRFKTAALHSAESEAGIPVLPADLDTDPWLFNCANGTIDLRSGTLRPHSRSDMITKVCPVAFDPEAKAPLWESTLNFFLDSNRPLIEYFQKIIGYALTGLVREHIFPIAYGEGDNGKSTILGALLDVFGKDYSIKCSRDLLMHNPRGGHPTARMDLFGIRLAVTIETEESHRLDEALVKELTGGDSIRGRRVREDNWEYKPSHTLIMATNHKPIIKGTDHAIWRRIRLIPFSVKIPKDKIDKAVPERLRAEAAGILAWAVNGCLNWQECQLDEPPEVMDATKDYRAAEDTLGAFFEEWVIWRPGAELRASELMEAYLYWAKSANERPLSGRAVGLALEERGISKRRSTGTIYCGMELSKDVPRPLFKNGDHGGDHGE
jgi:putative DNA primase/helicase